MSEIVDTDAELVTACLAGQREAFERIVARYQSLVCSLAYSATGSLGESEDLAQETFITAWKYLRPCLWLVGLGCAAAGVKCAVGFAAVARDYAVGIVASAAEANSAAAKTWVTGQWISDFAEIMLGQAYCWVILCLAIALGLGAWCRRPSRKEC